VFSIALPTIECPFPAKISPHAAELEEHTMGWGPGHGIVADDAGRRWLRTARFGELTARVCPEFGHDALVDIADWLVWLFAFDDEFCEDAGRRAGSQAMTGTLVHFLGVMAAPDQDYAAPFDRALADVWRRTVARATPTQRQRLAAAVNGYFLSLVWESAHSAGNVSLAEYRLMRPQTAGVPLWLMLVEIMGDFRPSAAEMADPAVVELHDRIAHVINWMNDILSYPREIEHGADALNLTTILASEPGVTPQQALTVAAAMQAEEMAHYLEAETAVHAGAGPGVRDYVRALRYVISGFHAWFVESGRYN
jgi:hypothetical protein